MSRVALILVLLAIDLAATFAKNHPSTGRGGESQCRRCRRASSSDPLDHDETWSVKLPDGGTSSPVVYGNKVFVTSQLAEKSTKKSLLTSVL